MFLLKPISYRGRELSLYQNERESVQNNNGVCPPPHSISDSETILYNVILVPNEVGIKRERHADTYLPA
jgi:hypothetical protein